ncbi:SsgA family sporulation/cell division regulator [Kitasatospora sp. NPDC085464]|uniref:SsgA family sporulation/cell division regulator n=1 Tax=Kitasatospora sp. NPDC085464 TaxID=3364063 RepID=UPI0037C80FF6
MHRDRPPLRAHPTAAHLPPLVLDVDRMLDEFTRLPSRAEFRFDPRTPAVIAVEFLAERGPSLVWRFGRALLHGGLTAMSGCGDVRMRPGRADEQPSSWLLLETPELEALFELPTGPLAAWLDATYRIVPAEAELEGIGWDAFLHGLLDHPGAPPE